MTGASYVLLLVFGVPALPLPLWIPACAGMTSWGVCRNDERRRRPCTAPLPWVPAFAGKTMGGVRGSWGRGGTPTTSLHLWVPVCAGMTGGGCAERQVLLVSEGGSRSSGTGGSRTAPTTGCGGRVAPFDRLRANGGYSPSSAGSEVMSVNVWTFADSAEVVSEAAA